MAQFSILLALLATSAFAVSCVKMEKMDKNETSHSIGGMLEQSGAQAFIYNPQLQGLNGTQGSAGGTSSKRFAKQFPALKKMKISQTAFTLDPCALRPAHVHQKADGLLFLSQGSKFVVGFVTDDNKPVVNEISSGASAIFPVGLVHYQQNLDCYTASYTISYNSEDPGTQMTYQSLLSLPTSALAATLGINVSSLNSVKSNGPMSAFIPNSDPECVQRCKLGGAQAPAPGAVASQSLSGRKLLAQ